MGTSAPISGPGIPLPVPQNLYPTELYNTPPDAASAYINLAAGAAITLQRGQFLIDCGKYGGLEWVDPVSGVWRINPDSYAARGTQIVNCDGQNYRIANRTGCPIGGVVTNAGSGYVQSSTTCTAGAGGSTWAAIVGGGVSINSITNAGAGYGVPPLILIPGPPPAANNSNGIGGVQATAYATLTSGTISSITMTNVGAGYQVAPTITIVPSPYDYNGAPTTAATATAALIGSGSIMAVLCTNFGAPQTTAPTLTISGAGLSATATATLLQTITGLSVRSGGSSFQNAAGFITVGGVPSGAVNTNPQIEETGFLPRPASGELFESGGSLISVSATYDGGLFAGTPNVLILANSGSLVGSGASVTPILGSSSTVILIQPTG
jgi:hypothetical protein